MRTILLLALLASPAALAAPALSTGTAPLEIAAPLAQGAPPSDPARQRELVLYPLSMQLNGTFTQHLGTHLTFVWHLQENFGLQLTGGYNWYNAESAFNGELVNKIGIEAEPATSLLSTWSALGGAEARPLHGEFSFFGGTAAHFSVVLTGGAGLGGTRHQLTPESLNSDGTITMATYGETGLRLMASVGAGLRLRLGQRFAVRVEVRDVFYTARVEKVNGCDAYDLGAIAGFIRTGMNTNRSDVANRLSSSCQLGTFTGSHANPGYDAPTALNLVRNPSSAVLNNLGLYLGASFLF